MPDNCPAREEILEHMRWAVKAWNGYMPQDTPRLTVELSQHRRECLICQGKAESAGELAGALFGQVVVMEAQKC